MIGGTMQGALGTKSVIDEPSTVSGRCNVQGPPTQQRFALKRSPFRDETNFCKMLCQN